MKTCPIDMAYHDVVNCDMFLRKIWVQKDGKPHNYWALVESYRTERGPRQRVVSYLGEMDKAGRLGVGNAAEGHPAIQDSLFEDTTAEWVEVDVRRVRTERSRRFGDVWLALELLKTNIWQSCSTNLGCNHRSDYNKIKFCSENLCLISAFAP